MLQRVTPLGFLNIAPVAATGLTLPVGAQQAEATSCSLLGNTLTVGGTITGAFAVGQIVVGTGIPANTYIQATSLQPNAITYQLSNPCTTESGITVIAYANQRVDFAEIRASGAAVNWRDDGVAPTALVGFPMLTSDPPLEYAGDLSAIQFIQQTGTAAVSVSFYKLIG